jgi:hypothetical protein
LLFSFEMAKIIAKEIVNKNIINIILTIIILALIALDALAIHDIFVGEPDVMYELAMILVSILVFVAIYYYVKQRKQKSTQL